MSRIFTSLLVCVAISWYGCATAQTVDGVEFHWESSGNGPAIVFIPGRNSSGDRTDWRYQVEEFEGDYRVITIDLPRVGPSLIPYAEAIEAVRAEAGIDQMVLVGHSSGGWVVGEYMMHYPQYLAGVVAVDTDFHGPSGALFEKSMTLDDSFEMPALYVLAVDGSILRRGIQPEALLQITPGGSVEVMPEGVGHHIPFEDPVGFNRLLREFVEEIDF